MKYFVQREHDLKLEHVCLDKAEAELIKKFCESNSKHKYFVYYGATEIKTTSFFRRFLMTIGVVK